MSPERKMKVHNESVCVYVREGEGMREGGERERKEERETCARCWGGIIVFHLGTFYIKVLKFTKQ